MYRYSDIKALFEECDANLQRIDKKYDFARSDESQKEVLKPLVKSTLEQLRSILEYSAQDIWESYTKKENTPSFPYGEDEIKFQRSLKRNLPGLDTQRQDLFLLVESIQPHRSGDNWLYDLCHYTNFNKHNRLKPQVRKESSSSLINLGDMFAIRDCGEFVYENCRVNGELISNGSPVTISNAMPLTDLQRAIGSVHVTKTFDWVEFHFEGSVHDVRALLTVSRRKIEKFVDELHSLI